MDNITITLTKDKADALCTLLSATHSNNDNPLRGLYDALRKQFSRSYPYKLSDAGYVHETYGTPMIVLEPRK
jgi:hypothetical protein